jgi:hypothetical protein
MLPWFGGPRLSKKALKLNYAGFKEMKSTPNVAMAVLLNLTPLDPLIMAETRMALYRLHTLKQPNVPKTVSGLLTIWKNVGDPLQDMHSDCIIPAYRHIKNFMVIIDQEYRKNNYSAFPDDALIWFTDGSRANPGTGSGIYGIRPEKRFTFCLSKYAMVFQTEIYAILQCACENIIRAYRHKQILIFSDSQAALKGASQPKSDFRTGCRMLGCSLCAGKPQ